MSVTATPTLSVAGLTIATGLSSGLYAVDELRISWGRASVLEQPNPATAQLTIRDKSVGADFARRTDLIGQPIVLGWAGSDGSSDVNFRGRITDVAVTPRPSGQGFDVVVAASSHEVDLANIKIWASYPAETFTARAARLAALLPAGVDGYLLPNRFDVGLESSLTAATDLGTYTAAAVTYAGEDLLSAWRTLFASMSPYPMTYQPGNKSLIFSSPRRRTYSSTRGLTMSAKLVASPDHAGRYVAASLDIPPGGGFLDAHRTGYGGALSQPFDSRITRVDLTYLDETAAYASKAVGASPVDAPLEPSIGRRALAVDTIHATAARAQQLADLYAAHLSRAGRTPRLAPLTWSSKREPLHTSQLASTLLICHERGETLFLNGSWLTRLGQRPLVGLLGSTVTYRAGEWEVDFVPGPVDVNPTPYAWAPVTIGASAATSAVRLRDIDPSVTIGDLGFIDVGAGFTSDTANPYRGNPT